MNMLSMTLNHPAEAFRKPSRVLSWGLVGLTALTLTVAHPILSKLVNDFSRPLFSGRTLLLLLLCAASYLLECLGFWAICRAYGSHARLSTHLEAWGLSFMPTLLCAIAAALAESFFFVFWGNAWLGVLLSVILFGALIWKIILYTVYLRNVACLEKKGFRPCFLFGAIWVMALAAANLAAGLIIPVL